MTAYTIITLISVVNIVVSYIGAKVGYTVHGVARGFEATAGAEASGGTGHDFIWYLTFGIVDEVSWDDWLQEPINEVTNTVGDMLGFLFDMLTFRVDNMPAFMGMIFLGMNILLGFVIVRTIRGVS